MKKCISFLGVAIFSISTCDITSCAAFADTALDSQKPLEIVTSDQVAELAVLMKISMKTSCDVGICISEADFNIISKEKVGTLHVRLVQNNKDSTNSSLSFMVEYPGLGIMSFEDRGLDGAVESFYVYEFKNNFESAQVKYFQLCFDIQKPDNCKNSENEPEASFRNGLYGVSVLTLKEALQSGLKKTGIKT